MNSKTSVIQRAEHDYDPAIVGVDKEAIKSLTVPAIAFEFPTTPAQTLFETYGIKSAIQFLIALNSNNYCFWNLDHNGKLIRFVYDGKVGAEGMIRAFTKAWGNSRTANQARGLLQHNDIEDINKCFPDIAMPASRAEIFSEIFSEFKLEETTDILIEQFAKGQFTVKQALVLADVFPKAFNDPYLKKAQLTIMWAAALYNADPTQVELTVAADYQLPKVLRGLKILHYSPSLLKLIDDHYPILSNGELERAIRAATIIACEEISRVHNISSPALDWWLWSQRNEYPVNFHLTFGTDY